MQKQLVVAGKSLPDLGDAINEKGSLVGARRYIGFHFGLTESDIDKKTTKEVKALVLAAGADADAVKVREKDYRVKREQFYANWNIINGALAADPTFRKGGRVRTNDKGEITGVTMSYTKLRGSLNKDAKIAALEAENARLRSTMALPVAASA